MKGFRSHPSSFPGLCPDASWSHARRKFFELADIAANARRGKDAPHISPLALEAVRRIDALFDIERAINGLTPSSRVAARQEQSAPLVDESGRPGCEKSAPSSRVDNDIAKAIDYMLKRWTAFTRFLDDGRICLIEQRSRTSAARTCPWAKVMALRRLRSWRTNAPPPCTP